jgi:hypothetical protein
MVKALSSLGAMWKKVEATTGSFSNVADGDYIGDLKEIKLAQSKKGRWQVEFTWEVADGEQAGKTQKQFYGVSDNNGNPDSVGMGYFKGTCEVIGLDLSEDANMWQDEFNAFLSENSNALYDITVKANGNYANVYVNSVSEFTKGTEGEETAAEEEATEEEAVEEEVVEVAEEEVYEEATEEEVVQQVVLPKKKVMAVAKPIAKPVAKVPVKVAAKPVAKVAAQPAKKVVQLARR